MSKRSNIKKIGFKDTNKAEPAKKAVKIDPSIIASQIREQLASFHDTLDDALKSTKPNRFVITNDGVAQVTSNKIGTFIAKAKKVPGAEKIDSKFSFNLPKKISYSSFLQILSFFREVCDKYDDAEAAVQIFWDEEKQDYFIYCPKQTISKATVDFERDPDMESKYLLVMDIHSHNTMGAFFSGTDDSDEKETRLYGVLGKIKDAKPEYKFRAMCGGNAIDLDIWDIFENPYAVTSFPSDWLDNIEEKKVIASKWDKGSWASSKTSSYSKNNQKDLYEEYYNGLYGYRSGYGYGYEYDKWDDDDDVVPYRSSKSTEKEEPLLKADCQDRIVTNDDIRDAIALMDENEVMELMTELANDGYDVFMEKVLFLMTKE